MMNEDLKNKILSGQKKEEVTDECRQFLCECDLFDIYCKYRRLGALLNVLQAYIAEYDEIPCEPACNTVTALYDIALRMETVNSEFRGLLKQQEEGRMNNE